MSLTFTLADVSLPAPEVLQVALRAGVRVDTELSEKGVRNGTIAMLVVPQRSTRGVRLSWSEGEGLALEAAPLASADDVALLVTCACDIASELGVPVSDGRRIASAADLRTAWKHARQLSHVRQDERVMRDLAQQSRLRLTGVNRAVILGPALMDRIPEEPGALVSWLRHVQWLPGKVPLHASSDRVHGDPTAPLVVALEPGTRLLLAPSDLVALPGEPEIVVPRDALLPALGPNGALVDEEQILVEPLSGEVWQSLRALLGARAVAEPGTWSRRAPPPVVLPVLRPPGWTGRSEAVCLDLHHGRPTGLPLVSMVRQQGKSSVLVTRESVPLGDEDACLARAVEALEQRLPAWELARDANGALQGLVMEDPLAAEAILSTSRLREAHELLGAQVLLAAAPIRGILRVERGDDAHDHADPAGLLAWSARIWKDATRSGTQTPLTPDLLIVVDGEVQGRTSSIEAVESPTDDGSIEMPGLAAVAAELSEDSLAEEEDAAEPTVFRGDSRAILALALPALGSLAAEPLVSLADTAMVSTIGDVAVGALGVATAVLSLAFVIFNFLAYGTTPLVAEARARGARQDAGRIVVAALFIAGWIGAIGAIVLVVLAPAFVGAMGATGALIPPSVDYLAIRALGAPALLLIIAGHGAFRGFQDTVTPLVVSLLIAGINLFADAVLILGFGFGVAGAAWASVGAQWAGAIAFLVLLLGPNGRRLSVPRELPRPEDVRRLLGVGSILSVRTLAVVGTMTLAASVATRLGTVEVAAHQVVAQLWMLAALLVDGLAVAGQTLVAAAPTRRHGRVVVLRLLRWGLGAGLALAGLLLIARPVVPYLFQVSPEALLAADRALMVAAAIQPIAALVFVADGLYLGARRFTFTAVAMVVSAVIGIALLLTLPTWLGLTGVWLALALFVVARAVLAGLGALGGNLRAASRSGGQTGAASR